jgi:glucose-1-phosphate cytidylyltransferase
MSHKAIILAGGLGTRLSEETSLKPKPMVEIGGKPILWHVMNIYAAHGIRDFVIALGYKGELIKEYLLNFHALNSDLSVDLATGESRIAGTEPPLDWKVQLVDTGHDTQTGGRVKRLSSRLGDDETFLLTYGDGLADVDVRAAIDFHQSHGKLATVTCVRPPARFGRVVFDGDRVTEFTEKPQSGEGWINGGFFVLDRKVLDRIQDDATIGERAPLETLAREGELMAFRHEGFFQPMDTLREKKQLEALWASGRAPWRVW